MDDSSTIEKSKHDAFYEQKYLEDFKVYVQSFEDFRSGLEGISKTCNDFQSLLSMFIPEAVRIVLSLHPIV